MENRLPPGRAVVFMPEAGAKIQSRGSVLAADQA
jgi:hypothetical protein